ncbi:MAG TPA: GNAT family N-acetyltransferase [Anaerolineales bacterium]|nr:GNAT family N-acetyltransferase [Anaerolineales bacterium]HMZ43073.1 GNAT family N-acetyltransferase [Anaerolineales bacterium]HNA52988.1 GNAT family N-acetyltransferase [Anaerolineales bacterium]HNH06379.1 GNAT family N-acetyltransferase [Anaerolineales bacterium]HNJ14569.1 GNAT family N-acetyltransferase [Anaerolineales bacterium]
MNSYLIRQAEPKDLPEIIQLCAEHAAFEQADYSPSGKADKLSAHLFNNPPACFCLVVEMDGALAGYATYSKEFSTWDADFYIHMDCLFLRPHARSMGIGEQLIKQIAQSAQALNCRLIQWQTPKFNARAVKFYKRIGATEKEKLRFFLTVDA